MSSPIADLAEDIKACIAVRARPMIWGLPGVGKTAMVKTIGRDLGLKVHTVIGAECEPTDITGIPALTDKKARDSRDREYPILQFAPRDWMVEIDREGGLIFLDELTSAPVSVQAPMLCMVQTGRCGDFQLDMDKVAIVCAGNPPHIAANGQELAAPMINRLVSFQYPHGAEAAVEWAENFVSYWGNPPPIVFGGRRIPEADWMRARAYVAGFVRRKPSLWHKMPEEETVRSSGGWPSGRSWEAVSWHVAYCLSRNLPVTAAFTRITGSIGEGTGVEFQTYVREASLPDPEAVLADPKNYKPSGRPDVDFAVLSSVSEAVIATPVLTDIPARLTAAAQVLNRAVSVKGDGGVPAYEAGTAAVRRLHDELMQDKDGKNPKYAPKLVPDKKLPKWATEVKDLMAPFATLLAKMGAK